MGQPGGKVGVVTPRRAELQEALRRHFVVRTLRADECISADWHRAQGHGAALRAAVVMLCTRTGEAAAEALLAAAVGEGGGGEGGGGEGGAEGGACRVSSTSSGKGARRDPPGVAPPVLSHVPALRRQRKKEPVPPSLA